MIFDDFFGKTLNLPKIIYGGLEVKGEVKLFFSLKLHFLRPPIGNIPRVGTGQDAPPFLKIRAPVGAREIGAALQVTAFARVVDMLLLLFSNI